MYVEALGKICITTAERGRCIKPMRLVISSPRGGWLGNISSLHGWARILCGRSRCGLARSHCGLATCWPRAARLARWLPSGAHQILGGVVVTDPGAEPQARKRGTSILKDARDGWNGAVAMGVRIFLRMAVERRAVRTQDLLGNATRWPDAACTSSPFFPPASTILSKSPCPFCSKQ